MRLGIVTSLLSSSRRPASVEAEDPLLELLDAAVGKAFSALCRPVQKNLAVLTVAFLRVLGAVRSGHGQLSLAALFRVLPTPGPHMRARSVCTVFCTILVWTRAASPTDWLGSSLVHAVGDSGRFCSTKPKRALRKLYARESLFKAGPCRWRFTPSNIRGRKRPRAARISWKKCFSRISGPLCLLVCDRCSLGIVATREW